MNDYEERSRNDRDNWTPAGEGHVKLIEEMPHPPISIGATHSLWMNEPNTAVLECTVESADIEGVTLRLPGPHHGLMVLPWAAIKDIQIKGDLPRAH